MKSSPEAIKDFCLFVRGRHSLCSDQHCLDHGWIMPWSSYYDRYVKYHAINLERYALLVEFRWLRENYNRYRPLNAPYINKDDIDELADIFIASFKQKPNEE